MGTIWLVTAGLLLLSCGCVSSLFLSFRSGSDIPAESHDLSSVELQALLDQPVVRVRMMERPKDSYLSEKIEDLGSHIGIQVVTEDGRHFLIYKGADFGSEGGTTVVVDAKRMSDKWKPVTNWKVPNDPTRVTDMVKSGGRDYNWFQNNCRDPPETTTNGVKPTEKPETPRDPIVDPRPETPPIATPNEGNGVSNVERSCSRIRRLSFRIRHGLGFRIGRSGSRLRRVGPRFKLVSYRLGRVRSRLERKNSRLWRVRSRLERVVLRIRRVCSVIEPVCSKVRKVDSRLGQLCSRVDSAISRVGRIGFRIGRVGVKIGRGAGSIVGRMGSSIGRIGSGIKRIVFRIGR